MGRGPFVHWNKARETTNYYLPDLCTTNNWMPSPCWADLCQALDIQEPHLTLTLKPCVSTLWMKKWKLREINKLVQVHTACKSLKNLHAEWLAGCLLYCSSYKPSGRVVENLRVPFPHQAPTPPHSHEIFFFFWRCWPQAEWSVRGRWCSKVGEDVNVCIINESQSPSLTLLSKCWQNNTLSKQ